MSEILGGIGIDKLNIFSINNYLDIKPIDIHTTNKGCELKYIEINSDEFIKFLNHENGDFLRYNKNSLYIVRGGDFIDVKNIFARVNNCRANIGRGGSQKAHILSPLDLRLSSYLMAMFNFDYKLINNLNTFNYISKDRYLSWKDNFYFKPILKKTATNINFKPIRNFNIPFYSNDLGQYHLECTDAKCKIN
jgi:hypothetical protein